MHAVKFLIFIILGLYISASAQQFRVSSRGSVTFSLSEKQNTVTVRYTAASGDAVLLVSLPFHHPLPSDYTISWDYGFSGGITGYRIYIKDDKGSFWRGMKEFTASPKGTASVNKVHFGRPGDQGTEFPADIDSVYISIPVSKKGKGSFTFSEFRLEEVYLTAKREMMPVMLTSKGSDIASQLLDNDAATFHTITPGKHQLRLNYHNPRSPGAIFLERAQTSDLSLKVYLMQGKKKKLLTEAAGTRRTDIYIPLPTHESSEYLVEFLTKYAFDLSEIQLLPQQANDHPVHLHRIMAGDTLKGFYPRGYTATPSAQTLLWANGERKVYINKDGQIELPHAGILVDPFLRILNETGTYLTSKNTVRYSPDSSRVYHSNRAYQLGELWVRAFVDTVNSTPYLNLILEAANLYHFKIKGRIFAAIRPLSSAPYAADDLLSFSEPGIHSAQLKNSSLVINRNQTVYLFTEPQYAGGFPFLKQDYRTALTGSDVYPPFPLTDKQGFGTVVLSYDFTLIPGSRRPIFISLPLEKEQTPLSSEYKNLEQRMRQYLPMQ